MRSLSSILILFLFLLTSCLSDVEAPKNDPAIPTNSFDSESMTRVSVELLSLDVSNNMLLSTLRCHYNQYLTEIWLTEGQTIEEFNYDTATATIKYK